MAGRLVIGQTVNILQFLGPRHGLAPKSDAGRLWTHQLQLTIADFVVEIHDTHHPVAGNLYYEDQKKEARLRAADFVKNRLPKFLGYFEKVLVQNVSGKRYMLGAQLTYADLSMFQVIAGLNYAFPNAMRKAARSAANRRVSRFAATNRLQRRGHLSPLPRVGHSALWSQIIAGALSAGMG